MGETTQATRYAIFEDGGKQYRAEEGALVRVDLKDADPGSEITFDKVLLLGGDGTKVGTPAGPGASVVAVEPIAVHVVESAASSGTLFATLATKAL